MNPYQPGEDNQDPYMVGYKAGAASRDAEVAELTGANVLNRNALRLQKEKTDQLRDLLRPFAALLQEHNRKGSDDQPIFQINDAAITLGNLRRALAATEPKP